MLPLVFKVLRDNPAVPAIVGMRIYRFGRAPQDVVTPYITWFLVNGRPEDQLSGAPCVDFDSVQIDCYSGDEEQAEELAYAARDALDTAGIANRMIRNFQDKDTKLYVLSLEADFILNR